MGRQFRLLCTRVFSRLATTGEAGNRIFTAEWHNYQRFPGVPTTPYRVARRANFIASFQARLYEVDNRIEFHYDLLRDDTICCYQTGISGGQPGSFGRVNLTRSGEFSSEWPSFNARSIDSSHLVDNLVFTLTPFSLPDIDNQAYTPGEAFAVLLPAATGVADGNTVTYALTTIWGQVVTPIGPPRGLHFDGNSRILSGRPMRTTRLSYTATQGTLTVERVFDVVINGPLTLPEQDNLTVTLGEAFALLLPEASSSSAHREDVTYVLTEVHSGSRLTQGTTINGLRFDGNSRMLSGRPTATTRLSYTATQGSDMASRTFTITVSSPPLLPEIPDQIYTVGAHVWLELPFATGGNGNFTYAVTGDIPAGLNFVSGRYSKPFGGVPTTETAPVTLTYRVLDDAGTDDTRDDTSASQAFTITVIAAGAPLALPELEDQAYTVGTAITLHLPKAAGGWLGLVQLSTLTGRIPAGLRFDGRPIIKGSTLTGIPTTETAPVTLTYTVTQGRPQNSFYRTVSQTFTITVNAAPLALAVVEDQTYRVGTAITLPLPEATGGVGFVRYALTGRIPSGLSFKANTSTRTLIGTPTTETASAVTLTYTATLGTFTVERVFDVVVIMPLALPEQDYLTYTPGAAFAVLLPAARGVADGNTVTYALTEVHSGSRVTQGSYYKRPAF